MENARKLTPKQQLFADEWLIDLNSTRAATRAGYSAKTANEQGARLLANVSVQEYIAERMKARQDRTEIDQDYVLTTIKDTVDRCRQAKPVTDRKGGQLLVETEDGALAPAFTFDANNVLRGCELLGKHLGMFGSKLELTGKEGGPVEVKAVPPAIMDMIKGNDTD